MDRCRTYGLFAMIGVALPLLLVGCFGDIFPDTRIPQSEQRDHAALVGPDWHLYRFGGPDGQKPITSEGPRARATTITFQRNTSPTEPDNVGSPEAEQQEDSTNSYPPVMTGEIQGWSGCNDYVGQFDKRAFDLRLEVGGTTLMGCHPEHLDQERRYLDALEQSVAYRVAGNYLFVFDGNGQPLLTYRSAECDRAEVTCPTPIPSESEPIRFTVTPQPHNPTAGNSITLTIQGHWPSSCRWPIDSQPSVSENSITITTTPSPTLIACNPQLRQVELEVEIDPLSAGSYTGRIVHSPPNTTDFELGRFELTVAEGR